MATAGKIIAMFHQIITFAQKHQNLSKPISPIFQTKVRPRSHRQLGKQPQPASSGSEKVIIPNLEMYPEAACTKCSPMSNIGHPQNRVRNKVAAPAPLDASLLWVQCQVLAMTLKSQMAENQATTSLNHLQPNSLAHPTRGGKTCCGLVSLKILTGEVQEERLLCRCPILWNTLPPEMRRDPLSFWKGLETWLCSLAWGGGAP